MTPGFLISPGDIYSLLNTFWCGRRNLFKSKNMHHDNLTGHSRILGKKEICFLIFQSSLIASDIMQLP
jgi:hypothetical protein